MGSGTIGVGVFRDWLSDVRKVSVVGTDDAATQDCVHILVISVSS